MPPMEFGAKRKLMFLPELISENQRLVLRLFREALIEIRCLNQLKRREACCHSNWIAGQRARLIDRPEARGVS